MELPSIAHAGDIRGKRILLRSGFNVPVHDGVVTNGFRIRQSLETIRFLQKAGAKVIVIAHIGRDANETLRPVFECLQKELPLTFSPEVLGEAVVAAVQTMREGDVMLLENLRSNEGEENNDEEFAKALAGLADLYVNDAFDAAHRAHASIVGIPKYLPSFAGLRFAREVQELSKALLPESPSLFILGGAKFETKLPILRMSLKHYDKVYIGGALAHDFFIAQGKEIGTSLHSDDPSGIEDLLEHPNIMLPRDVIVANADGHKRIVQTHEVKPDERINDIGPQSTRELSDLIKASRFILWNGPMGYYEGGYNQSTEAIAELIAARDNTAIVGGGDTVAAIAKLGLEEDFTFVSTGGGAMLDFLADGSLPGIDALINSH